MNKAAARIIAIDINEDKFEMAKLLGEFVPHTPGLEQINRAFSCSESMSQSD